MKSRPLGFGLKRRDIKPSAAWWALPKICTLAGPPTAAVSQVAVNSRHGREHMTLASQEIWRDILPSEGVTYITYRAVAIKSHRASGYGPIAIN